MDFKNSKVDSSLFVKGSFVDMLVFLVYVDDILIIGVHLVMSESLINSILDLL